MRSARRPSASTAWRVSSASGCSRQVDDRHVRTFAGAQHRPADARVAAGDQGDFAFELARTAVARRLVARARIQLGLDPRLFLMLLRKGRLRLLHGVHTSVSSEAACNASSGGNGAAGSERHPAAARKGTQPPAAWRVQEPWRAASANHPVVNLAASQLPGIGGGHGAGRCGGGAGDLRPLSPGAVRATPGAATPPRRSRSRCR
jgi:hypothetical protein